MDQDAVFGQEFSGKMRLIDAAKLMKSSFRNTDWTSWKNLRDDVERVDQMEDTTSNLEAGVRQITRHLELFLPDGIASGLEERHLCVNVEFLKGLAIPGRDVSLDEVFHFREKRRSEYDSFWNCLRKMSANLDVFWSSEARGQLEKTIAKELGSYERVSSESWGRRVLNRASFKFTIDVSTVAGFSSVAALQQYFTTDPFVLAAGASGTVRLSLDLMPSSEPVSDQATGMSYLANVRKL